MKQEMVIQTFPRVSRRFSNSWRRYESSENNWIRVSIATTLWRSNYKADWISLIVSATLRRPYIIPLMPHPCLAEQEAPRLLLLKMTPLDVVSREVQVRLMLDYLPSQQTHVYHHLINPQVQKVKVQKVKPRPERTILLCTSTTTQTLRLRLPLARRSSVIPPQAHSPSTTHPPLVTGPQLMSQLPRPSLIPKIPPHLTSDRVTLTLTLGTLVAPGPTIRITALQTLLMLNVVSTQKSHPLLRNGGIGLVNNNRDHLHPLVTRT